jgi:hypothetical protein
MAQFPLLWIERRNYPGFRRIKALCFHADYEDWLEDYSRRVMELHEQRHAIVPVEFESEAFESYCARYGLPPDPDSLARYVRFRASAYMDFPQAAGGGPLRMRPSGEARR